MRREDRIFLREMDTAIGTLKNMSKENKEYYNTLSDAEKRAYLLDRYREARRERITGRFFIRAIVIIAILCVIKLYIN